MTYEPDAIDYLELAEERARRPKYIRDGFGSYHRTVDCVCDCGHEWSCDAESSPGTGMTLEPETPACPVCGDDEFNFS